MDRAAYDQMADVDQTHWWYVARRKIVSALITRTVTLPADARILEIGCGTGHNFPVLSQFGDVDAIEVDDAMRAVATARLGKSLGSAPLPDLVGVEDGTYDLIALLDVLEHVENDVASLATIRRKLKPGGFILLTVPANPWMWSAHDTVNHHFRRYTRGTLRRVAQSAGARITFLGHFNTILFPLAAAVRLAGKLTGRTGADDAQPIDPLNHLFTALFSLERHMIGRAPMPFGMSLAAVLT